MNKVFESKRFWLAVAGVITVVVQSFVPIFSQEQIEAIVLVVASWIVGDSIRATDPSKQPTRY